MNTFGCFVSFYLEIVGIAFFSCSLFVPNFYKNYFTQLVKCFCRLHFPTVPKCIVALFKKSDKFFFLDWFYIPICIAFFETELLDFSVIYGNIGNDIFFSLVRGEALNVKETSCISCNCSVKRGTN